MTYKNKDSKMKGFKIDSVGKKKQEAWHMVPINTRGEIGANREKQK